MQLQNHFSTTDSTSVKKNETILSRAQWCMYYELLLDTLQVKDTVTEVEVQYLGKVPGEQRIIADNGNYDCDLQSCRMEYGKHYVAYVQGKVLLGIKQEVGQTDAEAGKTPEKTASGNNAGTKVGLITIPETVRVLLTQDPWTEAGTCWSVCIGKYHMESICFRCGRRLLRPKQQQTVVRGWHRTGSMKLLWKRQMAVH